MRRRSVAAVVMSAALAFSLAACGGGGDDNNNTDGDNAAPAFDAAIDKVYSPSDKTGGTLKMAISEDWDSVDPGDTYYGLSWNFLRIYARTLTTFKPVPGKGSQELVGDLAEGLGTPSDDGKTWTYKLRPNLKYEDGTPITSKDVKYAVLRTVDKGVLVNGPTYFGDFLALPEGYKGPYKSKGVNTDSAIETPDDLTIVFHLKQPFAGFDYFAQLPGTVPVPEAKDTGVKYKEHVISSGPYKFESYEEGKGFTLVRNPNWDKATDPLRPALPDRYEVTLGVEANDIDNRLISGDLDVDLAGTGVQPAVAGPGPQRPDPEGAGGQPGFRADLVHLDQPEGGPARQHRVPQGDHVRRGPHRSAGRVRRRAGRWSTIATSMLPPVIPGHENIDLVPGRCGQQG